MRTHDMPVYVSKEVTSGIQLLYPLYNIACTSEDRNAGRMSGAMPTSIDWPLKHPQRRRRRFFILLAVLAVIVFGGRTAVSYFVDLLWFRSLGYGSVFSKTLALQWEHLRALCGGHISYPVRIVSGSEAGASARFAERSHHSSSVDSR